MLRLCDRGDNARYIDMMVKIETKTIRCIISNILRSDNSIIICPLAIFLGAQKLIYHSCQCHTVFCFDNRYTLRDEINGVVSISLKSWLNCPIVSTGQKLPLM